MSCFKCQLGKNRLAKSYLLTPGSFVWTNLCYSQLEPEGLDQAYGFLWQRSWAFFSSISPIPLPLLPLHAPFPWAFFPLTEGESTAKEDTLQVSPVCTTCGDRAHAHGLVLLSHHTEHPKGAGVRAFLQALQQLTGSQARTLQQASLGIRRMSNKQFLRLAFRNHAFILSVVMVLDQELQGREKLLVNWECRQENITSSVSIRSLQMSQFTKKPLLATWSLELSASQWWQCVNSLLL